MHYYKHKLLNGVIMYLPNDEKIINDLLSESYNLRTRSSEPKIERLMRIAKHIEVNSPKKKVKKRKSKPFIPDYVI